MGIFSLFGNIAAGVQGARMGGKQFELGGQMIDTARMLSNIYERPEFETPQAIQMMMDLYSGRRFQNMPGMDTILNQLGQTTAEGATAIERMGRGSEGMGALTDLYAKQMQGEQNIGMANARYRDLNEVQYANALNTLGRWQNMGWQWNEADPYMQAQRKAEMLDIMGRMGQWEGLKTKMGSWATMFQGLGTSLDDTLKGIAPFGSIAGALMG